MVVFLWLSSRPPKHDTRKIKLHPCGFWLGFLLHADQVSHNQCSDAGRNKGLSQPQAGAPEAAVDSLTSGSTWFGLQSFGRC